MNTLLSKRMTIVATLALLVSLSTTLRAQDASSMPAVPAQAGAAAQALTGDQQTAANSALCSAMGSHFPNPASAGP